MNNRIRKILEHYELTASKLAEILNTQPSSISHILSGRNKPSVDLLEKIAIKFNEINLSWLITGNGEMIKRERLNSLTDDLTTPTPSLSNEQARNSGSRDLFSEQNTKSLINETDISVNQTLVNNKNDNKSIDQIVIFYKDGSFKSYKP